MLLPDAFAKKKSDQRSYTISFIGVDKNKPHSEKDIEMTADFDNFIGSLPDHLQPQHGMHHSQA